jgi:hypothetical protein
LYVFGITMGLSLTKSQWNCNFLEALKCSFFKITVVRCDSVKVTVNSNKHVLVYKVFNAFDIYLVSVCAFQFPFISYRHTFGNMCLHLLQDAISSNPWTENWVYYYTYISISLSMYIICIKILFSAEFCFPNWVEDCGG